jgi:hypothetical protein
MRTQGGQPLVAIYEQILGRAVLVKVQPLRSDEDFELGSLERRLPEDDGARRVVAVDRVNKPLDAWSLPHEVTLDFRYGDVPAGVEVGQQFNGVMRCSVGVAIAPSSGIRRPRHGAASRRAIGGGEDHAAESGGAAVLGNPVGAE